MKKYPVQGFCSLRRKDCCCKRCTKLQGHFLNTAASSEGLSAVLLVPLEGKMPLAEHLSPNLGITAQNKLHHRVWTCPDGGKPLGSDFQVNEETGAGDFKNTVVSLKSTWSLAQTAKSSCHEALRNKHPPLYWQSATTADVTTMAERVSPSERAFQTTPLWFRLRTVKYCI